MGQELYDKDKIKFLEMILLFSGSFALLWYSTIKAKIEFPLEIFLTFTAGLMSSGLLISCLLKKYLSHHENK